MASGEADPEARTLLQQFQTQVQSGGQAAGNAGTVLSELELAAHLDAWVAPLRGVLSAALLVLQGSADRSTPCCPPRACRLDVQLSALEASVRSADGMTREVLASSATDVRLGLQNGAGSSGLAAGASDSADEQPAGEGAGGQAGAHQAGQPAVAAAGAGSHGSGQQEGAGGPGEEAPRHQVVHPGGDGLPVHEPGGRPV
jgi:hypothetical protein